MSDTLRELMEQNWLKLIKDKCEKGIVFRKVIDGEEKYVINHVKAVKPSMPWVAAGGTEEEDRRECDRWHGYYLQKFGFLPSGCLDCRKIVCEVYKIVDLFALREAQLQLGMPAKCGIDIREHTNARYSGFWYCPYGCSVREGLDQLAEVRHKLANTVNEMGEPMEFDVYLKRGCTEMEQGAMRRFKVGSKHWDGLMSQDTLELERMLDHKLVFQRQLIEEEEGSHPVPIEQDISVMENWVMYAFKTGDKTYKYLDSSGVLRALFPPSDRYTEEDA